MPKWLRWVLFAAALGVFLYSGWKIFTIQSRYAKSRSVYEAAAEEFTQTAPPDAAVPTAEGSRDHTDGGGAGEPEDDTVRAPIVVNFETLCALNPDVVGWLYCPDTPINYPVVLGETNNTYLHTNYRGEYDPGGSVFADAADRRGFEDSNTIIYGHHMRDMSMLASLEYWMDQKFYDEHPVMWLLTPEGDYRVDLFAGYITSATSSTYTIYRGPGEEFDEYLARAQEDSVFTSPVVPDGNAKFILLSTCDYSFRNARTVLHGMLVPVDTVGGLIPPD